jgi:hypothetical protein
VSPPFFEPIMELSKYANDSLIFGLPPGIPLSVVFGPLMSRFFPSSPLLFLGPGVPQLDLGTEAGIADTKLGIRNRSQPHFLCRSHRLVSP